MIVEGLDERESGWVIFNNLSKQTTKNPLACELVVVPTEGKRGADTLVGLGLCHEMVDDK